MEADSLGTEFAIIKILLFKRCVELLPVESGKISRRECFLDLKEILS